MDQGELVDAGCALDALDAEAGAEVPAGAQVLDEGRHGLAEAAALFGGEAAVVGGEAGRGLVGGHGELLQDVRSPRPVGRGRCWLVVLKGVGDVVLSRGGLSAEWCVGVRSMTVESVVRSRWGLHRSVVVTSGVKGLAAQSAPELVNLTLHHRRPRFPDDRSAEGLPAVNRSGLRAERTDPGRSAPACHFWLPVPSEIQESADWPPPRPRREITAATIAAVAVTIAAPNIAAPVSTAPITTASTCISTASLSSTLAVE
ncbi:hypothetical protein ACFYNW_35055 [Streptomyces virginiae]|uniref:hypothetical protein n=1 Tax=Streptomyces virginiae TaxID=1961 RepID=UPI0036ED3A80